MKYNRQTIILTILLIGSIGLLCLDGCGTFGANPSPPTKLEQALFTTVTNTVTVVKTNEVAVPVFQTNQINLTITNQQNQVVTTVSNVVNETWHTNEVVITNDVPQYKLTPKQSVTTTAQMAGAGLNAVMPGVGTMVSTGIAALLAVWGGLRSTKATSMTHTSTALVQQMETVLEFVKALPNGSAYADQLTNFLQQHQAETGVVEEVAALLENEVSNPDAKVAANQVITAINSLKQVTTPIPPITINT